MFGEEHGGLEFTTQQDTLEVVGKKQTCVEKNTVNLYVYEVAKTKHVWLLSNTGCVEKKTHNL